MRNQMKKCKERKMEAGITLIALVVTIVVLIILATISINAVLGVNGLIQKAQQAKELHEEAARQEEEALNTLLGEYENALNGGGSSGSGGSSPEPTTLPTPTVPTIEYTDATLPESAVPNVTDGMTRVQYDSSSSKWVKVEKNETTGEVGAWYNYSDSIAKDGIAAKSWANVILPADGSTAADLFDASGNIVSGKNYVQLVWIPRYAYKITSQYHNNLGESTGGNIDIVFIGTDNKNGSTTYSTDYPTVTGAGTATGEMDDFVVHPAFNFGGTATLGGFWIGKYEASTSASNATGSYSASETIRTMPNVASRRSVTIGNMFALSQSMSSKNGLTGTTADPHLCKNDEWGAVAYLSVSKYGKNGQLTQNTSSSYITGIGGVGASTTGTEWGVYDMSGCSYELVAGYVANNHDKITEYGGNLAKSEYEKYVNKYEVGTNDTQENNYKKTNPTDSSNNVKYYGDALWETSRSYNGSNAGWFDCGFVFPSRNGPFFMRGGHSTISNGGPGAFTLGTHSGNDDTYKGFRVVVPVL